MFVNPNDMVPVTHEGDTIFIRAKMGLGVQAKVNDELVRIKIDLAKAQDGTTNEAEMRIGQRTQELVLLKHNIKKWEGPSFRDENGKEIPCTPGRIEMLEDFDHPLIVKVLEEINQRNTPRTETPKKEAGETDPKEPLTYGELKPGGGES